jgi:hypothetical protein
MAKTISELLGIPENVNRGRALIIAAGILLVFLVFMGSSAALAAGDVNITKIRHFGGSTEAVEVSGNYAYTIEPSPTAKAGRFPYAHISSLWLSSRRITASIASLIIRRGLTSEPLWL